MIARLRRGGILLEVVLALAILVVVGSFTLATASDATRATFNAERKAEAIDLAASLVSEYRSGIRSLRDVGDSSPLDPDDPRAERFDVVVEQSASAYPGLTVVEVRVSTADDGTRAVELATLVTLVRDSEGAS